MMKYTIVVLPFIGDYEFPGSLWQDNGENLTNLYVSTPTWSPILDLPRAVVHASRIYSYAYTFPDSYYPSLPPHTADFTRLELDARGRDFLLTYLQNC